MRKDKDKKIISAAVEKAVRTDQPQVVELLLKNGIRLKDDEGLFLTFEYKRRSLLTPLKAGGNNTAEVTPSPRIVLEDSMEVINAAFHDTTSDLNPDGDPFWVEVEVIYHPGMVYHCVMTQVIQIARATFGQEPTVTGIDVIAGDLQWLAQMNDPVVIPDEERFCICVYCTSAVLNFWCPRLPKDNPCY
ncbi:hypothetical protein CDV55_100370 [Aspergillus turcosus]|nr:hypothetical protein CDV55_100370 [Aspergillus turcosus]